MNRFKNAALAALMCAGLGLSGAASAGPVWTEQATGFEAHNLTGNAEDTIGSLSGIRGDLAFEAPSSGGVFYEVDVYRIQITSFGSFSARTVSSDPSDDTSLFLFDSAGRGVYMNDDNGADLLSELPAANSSGPSSNGFYYLAVALGGFEAFDGGGFANFLGGGGFSDVRGGSGAGALASWTGFDSLTEAAFNYSIELTGAAGAIPEPATLALVLLALAGAAASRRNAPGTRR